jgi:gluconate 2-dehydrogenase gamma chain
MGICSSTFVAALIYISLLWASRLTASFRPPRFTICGAGIRLHPEVGSLSAAKMDRRDFVKSIAAGGTAALSGWRALAELSAADTPQQSAYKVFTAPQAAMVGAIAEQLVPKDEFPGGVEAGVVPFIDAKLAGPYGKFYVDRYQSGLALVDKVSQKSAGGAFVSLNSGQQQKVLSSLEAGIEGEPAAREFFGLILEHTFEGYYGDPQHGANRNGESWKMIGFGG